MRKRSAHQVASQCHCEHLISAVLSDCHHNFQMTKPSVFSLLSKVSNSNSIKRQQSRKKKSFSGTEYPEVTFNIVGPSTPLSNSKGKQLAFSSKESDTERSSCLKKKLIELEGIYQHTRIQTGAVVLIDYNSG